MPYKSEAQRKYFYKLLDEGKISKETVEKFDRESVGLNLPERKTKTKSKKPPTPKKKRYY